MVFGYVSGTIRTVRGAIEPQVVTGAILMHEHVFHSLGLYGNDPDQILDDEDVLVEELKYAGSLGVQVVVDETTVDMGRRPDALRHASERSEVGIVACTGFYRELTYGAAKVAERSEADLAREMIHDIRDGIGDERLKAGAIGEIGTSDEGISDNEAKVLRACAHVQRETGAPVLTHTPFGKNAADQLDILERGGADPARVVIGHMCGEESFDRVLELLRRGVTLSFDRIGADYLGSDDDRVDRVVRVIDAGFSGQIVLSMDIARKRRLHRYGGHGFAGVQTFLPRLAARGVGPSTLSQIVRDNPLRILAF
jgi:phosphotriesterase-related protein